MVGAAVLWWVLSWAIATRITEGRIDASINEQRAIARQEIFNTATLIGRNFAFLKKIPAIIAQEPDLVGTLAQFGPDVSPSSLPRPARQLAYGADPSLKLLANRLGDITSVGIDQIVVVNAAGDCIASAGFEPWTTVTGLNLADRKYFQVARQGRPWRQFIFGSTTAAPEMVFTEPVMLDGLFLGAVVVIMDLDRLAIGPDTLLIDGGGLIILSQNPSLMMYRVPDILRGGQTDRHDGQGDAPLLLKLKPWPIAGQSDVVLREGDPLPAVMVRYDGIEGMVGIVVFRTLKRVLDIRREGYLLFGMFALLGLLVFAVTGVVIAFLNRRIEHARQLQELNGLLEWQANTDALTGCANRRHFLETMAAERYRAERYGGTFAVVMLDIDHFKRVNDRLGHAAGDEALKHVVAVISAQLRPSDLLGRLGGEEFAVLLPGADLGGAHATAERIRAVIEATACPFHQEALCLTLSAGVAQWRKEIDEPAEQLLERADSALYCAKSNGRNRVKSCCDQLAVP